MPNLVNPQVGETWRVQYPGDIEFTRVMKVEWVGMITVVLSNGSRVRTMRLSQVNFIERIENESE